MKLRTLAAVALIALATVVGALVLFVEGVDAFAFFNLGPVLLVIAAAVLVYRTGAGQWVDLGVPLVCAGFAILGLVAFAHLAWHFDWAGTATGSSTSGLLFLFLPMWAMLVGGVVTGVTWLLGVAFRGVRSRWLHRRKRDG